MWPFSRKKKEVKNKPNNSNAITKVDSGMIRISSIDFYGGYSDSDNQVYTLGFSELDEPGGNYILGQHGKLLLSGKLKRPNDGKVANNGTFIINDWMYGDTMKGTFYAFNKSGDKLVSRFFKANLINNGISIDGKYAACQCSSSEMENGSSLAFFNLESGKLLWQKHPDLGWADSYLFDCENQYLYLEYKDKGAFRYSFDGDFLDNDKLEICRIDSASGFELSLIAKEKLKKLEGNLLDDQAEEVLLLFHRALSKGLGTYPNEKASIYRLIGEIKESSGCISDAIKNYELALQCNPKVGVKRRLASLINNAPVTNINACELNSHAYK